MIFSFVSRAIDRIGNTIGHTLFSGILSGGIAGAVSGNPVVGLGVGLFTVGSILLNRVLAPRVRSQTRENILQTRQVAISPAIWVLGRARVGGQLILWHEDNRELHIAMLLAEGPCERIERVWVNGESFPFDRSTSGDATEVLSFQDRYRDNLEVHVFFSANGSQGAILRSRLPSSVWSDAHRVNGKSWVYIRLNQPSYRNVNDRLWTQFPDIQFLVQGLKFTWPGQDTPAWTDNAAAIRYWWLRERRGIPDEAIDLPSVRAAIAICDEVITVTLPDSHMEDFDNTFKRFTINGIVTSDENNRDVQEEMDFAWQGHVVEFDGRHHFRPGISSSETGDAAIVAPITGHIMPTDILDIPRIQPAPALQDRINEATISLLQSSAHEYLVYDIAPVIDQPSRDRDEVVLSNDLGQRLFVNNPIAAGWLLAIFLRRIRSSAVLTYSLRPSSGMTWMRLVPGDFVRVTDPELNLADFLTRVITVEIGQDLRVSVTLSEYSLDTYDFTLVLPPLQPRVLAPRPASVPAPSNLELTQTFVGTSDGIIRWTITATWDTVVHQTELSLTGPGKRQEATALSGEYSFDVETPGTWTVAARHVSRAGLVSPVITESLAFNESAASIDEVLMVRDTRQYGRTLRIVLEEPSYRTVSNIDIRFTLGIFQDEMSPLPVIDEAGWLDAQQMDLSVVNPNVRDQHLIIRGVIPFTGRYRIFIRMVNRVGAFSPITEVGIFNLSTLSNISAFSQAWPEWSGERINLYLWPYASRTQGEQFLLLPSQPTRLLTRAQWNGEEGWPFGAVSTAGDGTYYQSEPINLRADGREQGIYAVAARAEFYSPPGVTSTVTYQMEFYELSSPFGSTIIVDQTNGIAQITSQFFFCRIRLTGGSNAALSRFEINANRSID